MTAPTISVDGDRAVIECETGFARLMLSEARSMCQASVMAPGVSPAWKQRWAARTTILGDMLGKLPPAEDPRQPYGPIEETPAAPPVVRETPAAPATDDLEWSTEQEIAAAAGALEPPAADLDDLLG